MTDRPEPGWEAATWEGSRREQLRRALRLTPRERLAAILAAGDAARQLAASPEAGEAETPAAGGGIGSGRTGQG
ncbi:MAG TPA: hypothetical protein VKA55_09095 [Gammaproteobacteria bacterium]|nr:hypothetical protein [Gammaproteobacteria bacterium]